MKKNKIFDLPIASNLGNALTETMKSVSQHEGGIRQGEINLPNFKKEVIKTEEDAKIFVETMGNIPEPNDKLKKAFRDFKKQETLNEVALEFAKDHHEMYETNNLGSMHFGFCWGAKWQQKQMYSEEEVKHLMTLAFEQGFKKADVVEAGLEAKETDTEVNWIFLKHKK